MCVCVCVRLRFMDASLCHQIWLLSPCTPAVGLLYLGVSGGKFYWPFVVSNDNGAGHRCLCASIYFYMLAFLSCRPQRLKKTHWHQLVVNEKLLGNIFINQSKHYNPTVLTQCALIQSKEGSWDFLSWHLCDSGIYKMQIHLALELSWAVKWGSLRLALLSW